MLIYNVITAICLGLLVIQGIYMLINMRRGERSDKISFMRSFKNGKCVMIYLTAIPLYVIGHIYAGKDFFNSFFIAINKIVNLVVLKYDTSSIEKLMNENQLYYITIYIAFAMICCNALLFAFSLCGQHIWSFIGWLKRRFTINETLIIFGNNKSNIQIYKSDKERSKQIFDTLSQKDMEYLYQEDVYYSSCKTVDQKIKRIFKSFKMPEVPRENKKNEKDKNKNIEPCCKIDVSADTPATNKKRSKRNVNASSKKEIKKQGKNNENSSLCKTENKKTFKLFKRTEKPHKKTENEDSFLCETEDKKIKRILRLFKRTDKVYRIVINTENDDKNIRICRKFISAIEEFKQAYEDKKNNESKKKKKNENESKKKNENEDKNKDKLFLKIHIYVFGDPMYQALYSDIMEKGKGYIRYLNKYQAVAMDFIDKYPLSLFMNGNQIDYSTALVKDDVEINVALVGFGKTSHQILLTSVANNQFLKKGEREPELKKVNYYIYDKEDAENDKNLNHSYNRYKYECSNLKESEYLPLPTIPAEEKSVQMNINDKDFYNRIREIFTRSKNDANFLIIGFGTDLENIDLAQKLVEKRREWGLDNLVIFVKARAYHKEDTLIKDKKCYFIGNENDIVYDIDKIISDNIDKMALMRHKIYEIEGAITGGKLNPDDKKIKEKIKKCNENAEKKWHEQSQHKRDSNLYACLSLRSKLNLIGLDYKKKENDKDKDKDALSCEKYLEKYAKDDKIDFETYKNVMANEKPIIKYTLDFKDSLRKTFAIHEHQRWNSFMISQGTIPSSLYEIFFETKDNGNELTNGKNYESRRHGNLTTFEGLVQFRRLIANRDAIIDPVVKRLEKERKNKEDDFKLDKRPLIEHLLENDAYKKFMYEPSDYEAGADVIKYDYQLMDDAYWLLSKTGYKIIKKQPITD